MTISYNAAWPNSDVLWAGNFTFRIDETEPQLPQSSAFEGSNANIHSGPLK